MERDDTPAKTLVLCVCGVAKTCQNPEKPVKDEKTPNGASLKKMINIKGCTL